MTEPAFIQPPTSSLPTIDKLSSYATEDLLDSVKYLRLIYNPEVRGSRRHRCAIDSTDSPPSHQPELAVRVPSSQFRHAPPSCLGYFRQHELEVLRSDTFERSYAIRWLTALISHTERWETENDTAVATSTPLPHSKEVLIQEAASILAICAGTAAAGVITRNFTFMSNHKQGNAVQVQLTDAPLENHHFASVGAQTWGSACVLAEAIVEQPEEFGLLIKDDEISGKQELRALELGAGTGLVSLTVGKLLHNSARRIHSCVTILATDFYPPVLANLEANIRSNFSASHPKYIDDPLHISVHFLDWSLFSNMDVHRPPFDRPFDIIFGADVVYETEHAIWIKSCLKHLLRKSDPLCISPRPLFHLIIPLRPTHATESSTVEAVFPRQESVLQPGRQEELVIVAKEVIICDAGTGQGTDEVEYAYYKIGWC